MSDVPSIHGGMQIPLPNDKMNFLSKRYGGVVIKVCNAILNAKLKDGKYLISDKNLLLELDAIASSASITTSDLPWQITLQDTPDGRTFQVGAGYAVAQKKPGLTYASHGIFQSSGHDVDITVPAATTYFVWARCDGGVAEIQYGENADLPADWTEYPSTQGIDDFFPSTSQYGYFLIGYVAATVTPTAIVQYMVHHPQLEIVSQEEVVFQGSWTASTPYRQNSIVTYSGSTYLRYRILVGGDDGGDPSGGNDWTPI
jgi:hypothetical protein